MPKDIQYPVAAPNLKLVCPNCGHTKFYYSEARIFKVHIDDVQISQYLNDKGQVTDTVASVVLGKDYRGQGGGDVDSLIDYGAVICCRCEHELGDNDSLRPFYVKLNEDMYYDREKGYPRKQCFPEKHKYTKKSKCTGQRSKK